MAPVRTKKARLSEVQTTGRAKRPATEFVVDIEDKKFRTTPNFDVFWQFVAARQVIDDQRRAGIPPPWTDDRILTRTKFCNPYRVSDRSSQWMIKNVVEKGPSDHKETFFRIALWNVFTKIETYQLLEKTIGPIRWSTYNREEYVEVLEGAGSLYTAAFQKHGPRLGHERSYQNHLSLIESFMDTKLHEQLARCTSMQQAFVLISKYPSMGPFNAHQFLLELSYSELLNFSHSDFVCPGVGALKGAHLCFKSVRGGQNITVSDCIGLIRWMQERQNEHFARLGLTFNGLGPEKWPLQLCDIEHSLCELQKYVNCRGGSRGKVGFDPQRCQPLEPVVFPKAWSHPMRKQVRVDPEKLDYNNLEKQYVVNEILAEGFDEDGTKLYHIDWLGYDVGDRSWEPADDIRNDVPEIVEEWEEAQCSRKGAGAARSSRRRKRTGQH